MTGMSYMAAGQLDKCEVGMIAFNKVKLVIWDLDDTFWEGTLSEEEVCPVDLNIELVKKLTDIGIVNSICSKNDEQKAFKRLEEMGVEDYFVFSSINWEPKGKRIHSQLEAMKLRPENTLFVDDNPLNLQEAQYYNPGIMTALPEHLSQLEGYVLEKYREAEAQGRLEKNRKRLEQYRLLETKEADQKNSGSNEAFLYESNIKVAMEEDCAEQLERICELVGRTNQLNFTKVRSSREELSALIEDAGVRIGYVSVQDRYGVYGIVGFYAVRQNKLEHFLFSCRTMGMGIEQYVYEALGEPDLDIRGEVAGEIKKGFWPPWINQDKELDGVGKQAFTQKDGGKRILFKGPCDLDAIFSYIEEDTSIDSEFTYVNTKTGVTIEQISHTSHIVQALTLSREQKNMLAGGLPFGDENMYSDRIFTGNYDVVCLSILVDANLGVYRRREGGELVAFAEAYHPITDTLNWENYINGNYYSAGCKLTLDFLREFSEKYEFLGALRPEQTVSNLKFIREHLPEETLMLILLGSELRYEKNEFPAYEERHLTHRELNRQVREFAGQTENMQCIDVNHYLKGQESFYDHLNHYVPSVYYELSGEIIRLVNGHTGQKITEKSKKFLLVQNIKAPLKKVKKYVKKAVKKQ